jgi:tRNA pseudouridine13 synthase
MTDISKINLNLKLPYITKDVPGIGGIIKSRPEDFVVEEIPAYPPVGYGPHLYVNLTKRMQTTRDIQIKLAEIFDLNPDQIGKAGLKDKRAVSTQTFSVLYDNDDHVSSALSEKIEEELEVKVNWLKRHTNKLRAGHHKGNFFQIIIRDITVNGEESHKIIERISSFIHKTGVPNFYGIQRIGEFGENVLSGYSILKGKKRITDRWLRRFLISSLQSYLCNRYLVKRIDIGLFEKLVRGDVAKKHDTGGLFHVDDSDIDTVRFMKKEISFTAPIYGYKMKRAKIDAVQIEDGLMDQIGITFQDFRKFGIEGTRRLGRLLPEIDAKVEEDGVKLSFTLPKGGYATTVLREYMKTDVYSEHT